jgi:hypothetical protein
MIVGEIAQLIPFICIFYAFKSLCDIRIHGLLDQKHGQKAPIWTPIKKIIQSFRQINFDLMSKLTNGFFTRPRCFFIA